MMDICIRARTMLGNGMASEQREVDTVNAKSADHIACQSVLQMEANVHISNNTRHRCVFQTPARLPVTILGEIHSDQPPQTQWKTKYGYHEERKGQPKDLFKIKPCMAAALMSTYGCN